MRGYPSLSCPSPESKTIDKINNLCYNTDVNRTKEVTNMTTKDLEMILTLRNRNYKVVSSISEVPLGYVVWNIGRHNFPLRGYIPMCRPNRAHEDDYAIDITSLCAVPCQSEEQALEILKKSIREGAMSVPDLIENYHLNKVK